MDTRSFLRDCKSSVSGRQWRRIIDRSVRVFFFTNVSNELCVARLRRTSCLHRLMKSWSVNWPEKIKTSRKDRETVHHPIGTCLLTPSFSLFRLISLMARGRKLLVSSLEESSLIPSHYRAALYGKSRRLLIPRPHAISLVTAVYAARIVSRACVSSCPPSVGRLRRGFAVIIAARDKNRIAAARGCLRCAAVAFERKKEREKMRVRKTDDGAAGRNVRGIISARAWTGLTNGIRPWKTL